MKEDWRRPNLCYIFKKQAPWGYQIWYWEGVFRQGQKVCSISPAAESARSAKSEKRQKQPNVLQKYSIFLNAFATLIYMGFLAPWKSYFYSYFSGFSCSRAISGWMGWDGLGSLCGVIIWASLCGANKRSKLTSSMRWWLAVGKTFSLLFSLEDWSANRHCDDDDVDDDDIYLWAGVIQPAYTGNHFPHATPAKII